MSQSSGNQFQTDPKKVKAVKVIKVGDPYYYFFFLGEEENYGEDISTIELSFHGVENTLVLQREENKIGQITPYYFKAEYPSDTNIGISTATN